MQHRAQQFGRFVPGSLVTGAQVDKVGNRLHLRIGAPRQQSAVLAHSFSQRAGQAGLAKQATRLAFWQQQTRCRDGAPAGNFT